LKGGNKMKNIIMKSVKEILGEDSIGWREISKLLSKEEIIIEYLNRARERYALICDTPAHQRGEEDYIKARAVLNNLECLCISMGLIKSGTIK
jgi:hypothetical protein